MFLLGFLLLLLITTTIRAFTLLDVFFSEFLGLKIGLLLYHGVVVWYRCVILLRWGLCWSPLIPTAITTTTSMIATTLPVIIAIIRVIRVLRLILFDFLFSFFKELLLFSGVDLIATLLLLSKLLLPFFSFLLATFSALKRVELFGISNFNHVPSGLTFHCYFFLK